LLKHHDKFKWTEEANQVLQDLKHHLQLPPVLMAPQPSDYLLLYIAATTQVVNMAIMVEQQEEGHAFELQRPVYFISEVLSESKVRYPTIQKILYGILIISKKLCHYFDAYNTQLQAPDNHQVVGTSRFHGGVARKPSGSPNQPAGALGHVF
jgi:hypothetical protein